MTHRRNIRGQTPLDAAALERLAVGYAERYATTRAKLALYLRRKLAARGWGGETPPDVAGLVARIAGLGYVDDAAFAAARAATLSRRGYGARRIAATLRAAGVDPDDAAEAREIARDEGWDAALRFARRRAIGPFAEEEPDRAGREKMLAAMVRAGHPLPLSRRIVSARPGEIPEKDMP